MVTSRSEASDGERSDSVAAGSADTGRSDVVTVGPDVQLALPAAATPDEAAAIVAAIGAHLEDLEAAAEHASTDASWDGNRWTFAGRIEQLQGLRIRVPHGSPTDGWIAASRTDRF